MIEIQLTGSQWRHKAASVPETNKSYVDLYESIETLPDDQARVIQATLEGHTKREISRNMGIPLGRVIRDYWGGIAGLRGVLNS